MSSFLFIGRFLSPTLLKTFNSDFKGKGGLSNHNFEMSVIKGIDANVNNGFRCLSLPQTASFPIRYTRFYCKEEDYKIGGVPAHNVGVCNLLLINLLWKECAMYKAIKRELKRFDGEKVNVIVNCPVNALMRPLFKAAKRVGKTVETTLIIPDIPSLVTSTVGTSTNGIRKYLVDRMNQDSIKLASKFDHYVFLTDQMKELFPQKDYTVMEGLIDVSKLSNPEVETDKKGVQSLLYTGSLHEAYGILDLINDYIQGDFKNTELWICGSGNASDKVAAAAKEYPAIKFYGMVPSEKARELQRKATILINPRKNDGEYVKYSFPSKTIEYLLAKKPVIMHRLPGVPDEYYKYVYAPAGNSENGLQDVIRRVLNIDLREREARAQAGYDFIIENKNAKTQMQRVLDMFNS